MPLPAPFRRAPAIAPRVIPLVALALLRAESNDRYVADLVHTITLGHALVGDLAAYVEYAASASLSHDHPYAASFNTGLTLAPSAFAGLSVRF